MRIFAHRGLWSLKEDQNSIKAVENAFQKDLDVEIDIRYYKNSFLISHDEIREDFEYYKLEDMLKVIKKYPKRKFAIHFKYNDWEDCDPKSISSILKGYENQVFLFDMSLDYCLKLKECDEKIIVGVSVGDKHYHDGFANILDAIKSRIDVIWADENRQFYSKELFDLCKKYKKKVYCISPDLATEVGHPNSTLGFEYAIEKLIDYGADGICTDKSMKIKDIYADYSSRRR